MRGGSNEAGPRTSKRINDGRLLTRKRCGYIQLVELDDSEKVVAMEFRNSYLGGQLKVLRKSQLATIN